ncbi:transposase [Alicyclobacillus hesperidum subsp. aegles]|nr:transposase [Alicyclobacillus hesperidum subsp. aegles]
MHKSIDRLAALVQASFQLDPFSSCPFVFCNRQWDKLKILHWFHNGFWLYYRRLERGRFAWPEVKDAKTLIITRRELNCLLDGLPLEQPKVHRAVHARSAI